MRMSQQGIVPGISAEQVDQANRSWDFLESHAISGVVLYGLNIVHERENKEERKRLSEGVSVIVTLTDGFVSRRPSLTLTITGVRPNTYGSY